MSESMRKLRNKLATKYHEFHCPCMHDDLSKSCTCDLGVYQNLAHDAVAEVEAEAWLKRKEVRDLEAEIGDAGLEYMALQEKLNAHLEKELQYTHKEMVKMCDEAREQGRKGVG